MRTATYLFIILSIVMGCTSSNNVKSENLNVFLLVDNTEAQKEARADLFSADDFYKNHVKSIYGERIINPAIVWSFISDVTQNKSKKLSLPKIAVGSETTLTLANLEFKKLKKSYESEMAKAVSLYLGPCEGKPRSSIYKPLLNIINKSDPGSGKNLIVIFSDMVENSSCINMYEDLKPALIELKAKKLEECNGKFTPLGQTEVVIVYQAKDSYDDDRFQYALKVWGKIFDDADIAYKVVANL